MRISLALAAALTAPVLLLTACGTSGTHTKPIKGTVVEKEYEPAKTKKTKVPITMQICATTQVKKKVKGKTKKVSGRTCTSAATGRTRTVTTTTRKECYELDIRLSNGNETEVCDRHAFYVLTPGDPYSSSIDYSKKVRR